MSGSSASSWSKARRAALAIGVGCSLMAAPAWGQNATLAARKVSAQAGHTLNDVPATSS